MFSLALDIIFLKEREGNELKTETQRALPPALLSAVTHLLDDIEMHDNGGWRDGFSAEGWADPRLPLMYRGGTELLLYNQELAWQSPEWPGARALRTLWLQMPRVQLLPL